LFYTAFAKWQDFSTFSGYFGHKGSKQSGNSANDIKPLSYIYNHMAGKSCNDFLNRIGALRFYEVVRMADSASATISVAEPHHFYAAPAPDKNFDAAPAPTPTLLFSKAKF
jgi:hypothetical protein